MDKIQIHIVQTQLKFASLVRNSGPNFVDHLSQTGFEFGSQISSSIFRGHKNIFTLEFTISDGSSYRVLVSIDSLSLRETFKSKRVYCTLCRVHVAKASVKCLKHIDCRILKQFGSLSQNVNMRSLYRGGQSLLQQ
jgi:hypothetical protein